MKIINFSLNFAFSYKNIFYLLFTAFLIGFTLFFLFDFFKMNVKYRLLHLTSFSIEIGNVIITFLAILIVFLCLLLQSKILVNPQNTLIVDYINEDVNEKQINMSKEQIINDILNGKITENKNNLPVYSQEIPNNRKNSQIHKFTNKRLQ